MSNNVIIMRKFLSDDSNSFVDVRSSEYGSFDCWRSTTITVYDGYRSIDFSYDMDSDSDTLEADYNKAVGELEAIKQACNAAMDEITDAYGKAELQKLEDGEEEDAVQE